MAKPPPDRGDGVTPVQRQGYPSIRSVWKCRLCDAKTCHRHNPNTRDALLSSETMGESGGKHRTGAKPGSRSAPNHQDRRSPNKTKNAGIIQLDATAGNQR